MRVLAAHGDAERLSIRAAAAEAQVTPPSVYRCFPDRRALVHAAVQACFGRFEAHLAQAELGTPDPFEALRRRCRAAEGIPIRNLATVAGLSPARVHQLLAAVDLEALDVVAGQLREVGWPAPEDPDSGGDGSRSRFHQNH